MFLLYLLEVLNHGSVNRSGLSFNFSLIKDVTNNIKLSIREKSDVEIVALSQVLSSKTDNEF